MKRLQGGKTFGADVVGTSVVWAWEGKALFPLFDGFHSLATYIVKPILFLQKEVKEHLALFPRASSIYQLF